MNNNMNMQMNGDSKKIMQISSTVYGMGDTAYT